VRYILNLIKKSYLIVPRRERQHALERYESWKKIRARALENANGHLPEGFAEDEPQPPPPPSPEGDIVDLAMDLNAVSIDGEVPHDLDDSGIERVPTADPGLDVSGGIQKASFSARIDVLVQRPLPEVGTSLDQSPLGGGTHVRRRSVLPGK
jgi:serine/threonine-protein phosphatase 2A regulatory subunit B'